MTGQQLLARRVRGLREGFELQRTLAEQYLDDWTLERSERINWQNAVHLYKDRAENWQAVWENERVP